MPPYCLIVFHSVRSDPLRLVLNPVFVITLNADVRRGDLLRYPKEVSFVSVPKVLQVVEGVVLDLRRNDQCDGLKLLTILPSIAKSCSLTTTHSIQENPEGK